ncbi:MAG: hypothetical protein MJ204_04005 [Bacteroidales bacterium]|nr:hypothetical protein [Bacteroidales bacterium]
MPSIKLFFNEHESYNKMRNWVNFILENSPTYHKSYLLKEEDRDNSNAIIITSSDKTWIELYNDWYLNMNVVLELKPKQLVLD